MRRDVVLEVLETRRVLRLTRPGRLVPWLGPALRGMTAMRFKDDVCRYPPGARRYCKGCPKMAGCPYGETVEPDPPPHVHVPAGLEDAARPLVIDAAFPAPVEAAVGTRLPVRVVFVGRKAAGHAAAFWDAMAEAGRASGFDPDRATFRVEMDPSRPASVWHQVTLPTDPDAAGQPVNVKVELTSPLVLRSGDDRQHPVTTMSFGDLLRASLRTLGPLFRLYATPLPDEAFRPLKELAEVVPTLRASFEPFRQAKWSNRGGQHVTVAGVVGEAEYGPVPAVLVPWLEWGGRLHAGGHRVAGAGGWRTWGLTGSC